QDARGGPGVGAPPVRDRPPPRPSGLALPAGVPGLAGPAGQGPGPGVQGSFGPGGRIRTRGRLASGLRHLRRATGGPGGGSRAARVPAPGWPPSGVLPGGRGRPGVRPSNRAAGRRRPPGPGRPPRAATGLSPQHMSATVAPASTLQVVATAGHVDHGKSSLILRLTDIDPDRLAEEKRRGLTIDLGFAWATLPSGREVGFVDVPGDERFLRNMLAGAAPV